MAKIRMGFVSNSSSSSFIIIVPKGMEPTAENFHRAIWETDENIHFCSPWTWYESPGVDSKVVAEDIAKQIAEKRPLDDSGTPARKIKDLALVVEADDYPELEKYWNGRTYDWPAREAALLEIQKKIADDLLKKFPNHDFYKISYGDGNGDFESQCEHGPALNDHPRIIRYSHH